MKEGHAEGLTWMFAVVGFIYVIGITSNPLGYITLMLTTYAIYFLLKKEEKREIAKG